VTKGSEGQPIISVGSLNDLKKGNACSERATFGLGKRFFRFNEGTFSVGKGSTGNEIHIAAYKYPEISPGVWVLLAIGIAISVILIGLTTYCMIKSCLRRGKKHVSYYYIEIDDHID
jgi:hypothetical protein